MAVVGKIIASLSAPVIGTPGMLLIASVSHRYRCFFIRNYDRDEGSAFIEKVFNPSQEINQVVPHEEDS